HEALLKLIDNQANHLASTSDAYKVQEILERFA
ncbi:gfo/Idh/MocA family oxidoreductase, partial [Campylobacter jejuni]|nr:gfo/Idh/MocA family oxidoreductase [Campylobacter jejuni]